MLSCYHTETRTDHLFFLGLILMAGLLQWDPLICLTTASVISAPIKWDTKTAHLLYLPFKGHPQRFFQLCNPDLRLCIYVLQLRNPAAKNPYFLFLFGNIITGIHVAYGVRFQPQGYVGGKVNTRRPRVCKIVTSSEVRCQRPLVSKKQESIALTLSILLHRYIVVKIIVHGVQ